MMRQLYWKLREEKYMKTSLVDALELGQGKL